MEGQNMARSTKAQDETAAAPAEVETKAGRVAMLVPAHARTNYAEMVKRHAADHGVSVDEARARQLDVWRAQHAQAPADGWDVLADWLETANLDEPELYSTRVDPAVDERVRAVQHAKAQHDYPLDGFNQAEVDSILAHREALKAVNSEVLAEQPAPAEAAE